MNYGLPYMGGKNKLACGGNSFNEESSINEMDYEF